MYIISFDQKSTTHSTEILTSCPHRKHKAASFKLFQVVSSCFNQSIVVPIVAVAAIDRTWC